MWRSTGTHRRPGGSVDGVGGIRIGVLGQLDVVVDDRTVTVSSRAQRLLLLRLAIDAGRAVSVDALADAIWDEDLPKDPTNATRYHVWQLRKTIGEAVIETTSGGYRLDPTENTLDAREFDELVEGGMGTSDAGSRLVALETALAMWRGQPYLEAANSEFAQPEIRRLTELYRVAREMRARALVDLDRTEEAVPVLEGLLEAYPHSEGSWSALMTALYRSGRQADALRAYQRARSVLGDDLGIEPTAELRDLEGRVLLQDEGLRHTERPTTNLPLSLTSFVGRREEIRAIADLLTGNRLISIVGVGGAGKTRLALETARTLTAQFADGIWLADLTTLRAGDEPFELLAELFGLSARGQGDSDRTEVLAFLNRRSVLLILDNCEHILDEASGVALGILERSPGVRILATSRAPLHVAGEVVFAIPVLASPPDGADWGDIITTDSASLFLARAANAGATIDHTFENAEALVRICRAVEGMPLGLELAAARARTIGVIDLATELERHLGSYGELRGTSERHRTMTALIQWGFDLLDEDAQVVFGRLGVFAGGFTPEAAAYLAATPGVPDSRIGEILDLLVERSMVERSGGRSSRHRLLEPFRLFALEILEARGDLEVVTSLHAAAYFDMIVGANDYTRGARRNEIYGAHTVEAANIRSALEHFENAGDHRKLCTMVAALSRYWITTLRVEEQHRWGRACLPHLDDLDDTVAAGYIHAMIAHSSDSATSSIDRSAHMRKALDLATAAGDELAYADFIVLFLGQTDALAFGELLLPGEDETLAERAIDIFRRHDDRWGLVDALLALCVAKLWFHAREPRDVIAIAEEARRVAMDNADPDGVVRALLNEAAARTADPVLREQDDKTIQLFEEMIARAELTITPEPLGDALNNYAWFLFGRGEVDSALDLEQRLAALADDVGMPYLSVVGHTSITIFLEEFDLDGARQSLLTAFDRAQARGVDRQTVWVVETAARVLDRLGSHELAAKLVGAADEHRLGDRNARPNWDQEYHAETVARIRKAVGARYESLHGEGGNWSISEATDRAVAALSSS